VEVIKLTREVLKLIAITPLRSSGKEGVGKKKTEWGNLLGRRGLHLGEKRSSEESTKQRVKDTEKTEETRPLGNTQEKKGGIGKGQQN